VEYIQPVQWNVQAFDKLVLPPSQKQLIKALVESHQDSHSNFDDFIEGKGRGLNIVLHGAPGTGKTYSAESIADYTKSPLYVLSAGDLGADPVEMEKSLSRTLRLCTIWNAVLLLDEADVFLEERSLHDLERNALVSIFLRLLEYYSGILFLTTNR
jgi:AAA+ superfamily predicted ATPase